MKPEFRPCKQLVGIVQAQVGKDVAGAFLEFGVPLFVISSCFARSFASAYRCLIN